MFLDRLSLSVLMVAICAVLLVGCASTSHPPEDVVPLNAEACGPKIFSARLTNYESYPEPGSEECIKYSGCKWAGQFAGVEGKQTEEWVARHNIAAVHSKDWEWLRHKTLRLRQENRTILVQVLDLCSDTDCDGCCTANLGGDGYLIDIEKYTMQRFGSGDGLVEFQVCR